VERGDSVSRPSIEDALRERQSFDSQTTSNCIRAYDEKPIRIDRLATANEILPPTLSRSDVLAHPVPARSDMRGRRETCMKEDGIGSIGVEVAPRFVGDGIVW
jgi:hypothetical protein